MITYIHPVVAALSERYSPVQRRVGFQRGQHHPAGLDFVYSAVAGTQTKKSRRQLQAVVGWSARIQMASGQRCSQLLRVSSCHRALNGRLRTKCAPTKCTTSWLILSEEASRGGRLLGGIGLAEKTSRTGVSTSSKAPGIACGMVS
jgi:hypothetical protein